MRFFRLTFLLALLAAHSAQALQLDWNGQFWFDNHWLNNYQLDRSRPSYDADPEMISSGSPYVPGAGERNVVWYTAFLRLKPKAVVNDNVSIRTELHVGSPIYGFFGRGFPAGRDENFNFTTSSKDGMGITAQRFWANLITDFGTFDIGRAPIHWGLGAIWNSGDKLFDRYQSTGDMIRLTSKFGNFWITPFLSKVAVGNNVAGATDAAGNIVRGNDDVTDYNLAAKYDNPEEDFELGIMWTRRSGNIAQRSIRFNTAAPATGSTRVNFNIYDFYAKKRFGKFSFGLEFPLFSGSLGAMDGLNEFDYKAYALVFESAYNSDRWDISLKAGHIPGQPSGGTGDNRFRAVYLNRNYGLGLIMFHYNIYGMYNNNPESNAGTNLRSPYDAPLVNANYVALTPALKLDKWTLKSAFILAYADQAATVGKRFYNYERRQFFNSIASQDKFLGKEVDLGVAFQWDESTSISWDTGVWFPGSYYSFTNLAAYKPYELSFMFASQVKLGINF